MPAAPSTPPANCPDGTTFAGRRGLKKVLASSHRDEFVDTVIEKLLTYALGRGLEYYDKPAVRSIMREAARDDYRMSALDYRHRQQHTISDEEDSGPMIITKKSSAPPHVSARSRHALALPLLDAMVPAFAATSKTAAKPAVRLGFVYVPNGIIMDQWTPAAEGTGFEFTPTMKALEPFRDHLLVLSGLAQVNGSALGDGAGDHARAGATWLTGVHPKKTEGADIHAGISADQIAAREFGKIDAACLARARPRDADAGRRLRFGL